MRRNIRKANLNDRDSLFLLVTQFATSFEPDRELFEFSFRNIVADDSACLLVAGAPGEVVGYCLGFDHYTFYANGRVAWVEEIMVKPELRRENIGTALMAAFETWAKSRESALIALATRRASPFYVALGYEESAAYFRKLL
jgi:GNAT superfamily N-acetyltransferase